MGAHKSQLKRKEIRQLLQDISCSKMRKMSLSLLYKRWTWSDKACFCFTGRGMEHCVISVCVCEYVMAESHQACGVLDEGTRLIQCVG